MLIERDWRRWVAARPVVDVEVDYGDAILGIESTDRSSNDGVVVQKVLPGSAARRAGIRRGDVVVAVDGQATRSLLELRKALGTRQVGERIRVRLRREGQYLTLSVTLRAFQPVMVP